MRIFIVIYSSLLVLLVRGQSTGVNQCVIHAGPLPLNAQVPGCVTPPCQTPQLQNLVVDVIFRPSRSIGNMTSLATAVLRIGQIEINTPFELGERANTCNFLNNAVCPVEVGEMVQHRLQMMISNVFPVGTLATVEFRVVDNDRSNEPVWCIRLPIHIRPPVPTEDANAALSPK